MTPTYQRIWGAMRSCDTILSRLILPITMKCTDHNIWAFLQPRETEDFWHKLYVETAKGNTPEGSLKKNNYRVEKKRTSW